MRMITGVTTLFKGSATTLSSMSLCLTLSGIGLFAFLPLADAKEYEIKQIADESLINRDPSISSSGIIAWHGFEKNELEAFGKDIFTYIDGQTQNLSKDATEKKSANINPVVQDNRILWTTTVSSYPRKGSYSWDLVDVIKKDPDAPGRDLGANMILINAAEQEFVPVNDPEVSSNYFGDAAPPPVGRTPSGNNELMYWDETEGVKRLTKDVRNDLAPHFHGDLVAWQKAKGWPFGWEIMVYDFKTDERFQLTTNYYYDMGPKVYGEQVTYYGWDGNDFEIFLYQHGVDGITQVTSNDYDDVSPVIWDGKIAWQGYKRVESDVYLYDGTNIQVISNNPDGDDISPSIWNGQVTWQGFDGDDFEIYLYDGELTVKLTENLFDDVNPSIKDDAVVWMGYADNWDPEIFAWLTKEQLMLQITTNEVEDRMPQTAGGKLIWQADEETGSHIFLAEPK